MPVLLSPCRDYVSRKGVVELGYEPAPYEPPWDSWRVGLLVSNRLVVGL